MKIEELGEEEGNVTEVLCYLLCSCVSLNIGTLCLGRCNSLELIVEV